MNLLSCLYQSSVGEGIDRSPWRPLVVLVDVLVLVKCGSLAEITLF